MRCCCKLLSNTSGAVLNGVYKSEMWNCLKKKEMLKMLIFNVLVLLQCLCVKAQIDYDRNSIYQTNKVTSGSFAPTEQSSQQDVLKELGVDLSNEGKPPNLKNQILKVISRSWKVSDVVVKVPAWKIHRKILSTFFMSKSFFRKPFETSQSRILYENPVFSKNKRRFMIL